MALQSGLNLVGKLIGFTPTERNPEYFRIGVQVSTPDSFGSMNDETIIINSNSTHIKRLETALNNAKGRAVMINILTRAVSGRNGAFISYDAFSGTQINALPAVEKQQ